MTHTNSFARLAAAYVLTAGMLTTLPSYAETNGSAKSSTKTERSETETLFTSGKASELKEKHQKRLAAFKAKMAERAERLEEKKQATKKAEAKKVRKSSLKKKKATTKTKSVAKKKTANKGKFGNLIAKYAAQHGVPIKLAKAVVQVESSFRPNVTGAAGEIGLMQIKLSTARGMGYKGGAKELYQPAKNLFWGMKYLGKAHQLSGGSTCGTILKYNAGHYAKRNNPVSTRYCKRVRQIMA